MREVLPMDWELSAWICAMVKFFHNFIQARLILSINFTWFKIKN